MKNISFLLIVIFFFFLSMIYALQQNIVVNGNFTTGSSTGWTYSEEDASSVATSNFDTVGGDDNPGVWYFEVNDSLTDTGYTVFGNLTNEGGIWLNPGTLVSATVLFSYKQTWNESQPITNWIKVFLIKPDTSEVLLFSRNSTVNDTVYQSESIDVGISNFSSSGTYKIKLYNYVETEISNKLVIKNYWDDVDLVLVYLDEVAPIISVQSPTNKSYNISSIWANLTLDEEGSWCGYSLDGATNVTMSNTSGNWNSLVEGLSDSVHNITFSCNDTVGNMNSSGVTVYFSVDTVLPILYVQSPENTTYSVKQADLNVSAEETIDVWSYSLNGEVNVTFDPNTTITILAGVNNVTIYANDTSGNLNSTIVYFSLNTTLEVSLVEPSTVFTTSIIQNTTFIVNATVVCREGGCGDVSGTVRYNKTSSNPDTPVNITDLAEPFFIDEASPLSTKSCSTNPLVEDEYCNLTWVLNVTDPTFDMWEIDVNFSSDSGWTFLNTTSSSIIQVVPCVVDITVNWNSIDFDNPLTPNTYQNPALENDNNLYNITINDGSCNTDLYIKGTDMEDSDIGYTLGVGNLTWSNSSNLYSTSYNMTKTYVPLKFDVVPLTNITMWYWINVPPIFAAEYNGTVFIQGVENGNPQP